MIDILRQLKYTSTWDRKISDRHTKGYAGLMGEKKTNIISASKKNNLNRKYHQIMIKHEYTRGSIFRKSLLSTELPVELYILCRYIN